MPSIAIVLPMSALGADATVDQSISFGIIDMNPAGDTITIDARGGATTPASASNSVVTGGYSGLITVTSPVVEHVEILYPASINMSSGPNTITIISIDFYSQYSVGGADTPGGGGALTISVGGRIKLEQGQTNGSYSAQIPITLNFS